MNEQLPESVFLSAFALHPAGVAVVTTVDKDGNPVGFTATSLASFSASPPRASFNIAQHASSYPSLAVGARVLLHFLSEDQVAVAQKMSGPAILRFRGEHWQADSNGLPRLSCVRAVLEAHVVSVVEVGSSSAIVLEIDGGETNADTSPLVYVERRYRAVGEAVD